ILGAGDSSVEIWDTSVITGTFDAGGGTNTLTLKGDSFTYDGQFNNFQKLNIHLSSNKILNLTGTHSYTNGIDVDSGALSVNGVLHGLMSVKTGGALKGVGALDQVALNAGATLAPGNSIGTITV